MKMFVAVASTAIALTFAAPANAVLLNFVYSGTDGSSPPNTEFASFQLDSNPIPDYVSDGLFFVIYDVPGSYQYGSYTSSLNDLIFYSAALDGGFSTSDGLITASGDVVYSGTEAAPVFTPGTYNLTDFIAGGTQTLTISLATPAVPETATWAMMIGGFGLMGAAIRRRRVTTTVSYA